MNRFRKIIELNYRNYPLLDEFYCSLIKVALDNKYKDLKGFYLPIKESDIDNAIFEISNNEFIKISGHEVRFIKLKEIFVTPPLFKIMINNLRNNDDQKIILTIPEEEKGFDLAIFIGAKDSILSIDKELEKAVRELKAFFIQIKFFLDYNQMRDILLKPVEISRIKKLIDDIQIKYSLNFDFFLYIFLRSYLKIDSVYLKKLFSDFINLKSKIILGLIPLMDIEYEDTEGNKKILPLKKGRLNFLIGEIFQDKFYLVDFPSPLSCV
jgi:hypothetical protein